MFNWYAAPTFGAALLFWLLATYILTRTAPRPVVLATAAAQAAGAAFLLGQAMQANATTVEEWRPWARDLDWGSTIAPTLWYWVTVLLLRDQEAEGAGAFARRVGYPLGALFTVTSVALTVGDLAGDWLQVWSAPFAVPPAEDPYFGFHVATGPLYPVFVGLTAATTLGAALNLWLGWRRSADPDRRRRFRWLVGGAALLVGGSASLALATWLDLRWWPVWLSHLTLGVALGIMALNVAAYSLLLRGQVLRTDLLYFLTAIGTICLVYVLVLALAGGGYSFRLLELIALTALLVILSHALVDVARRAFDRLFFGRDVRRLRSDLASAAQSAALAPDLGAVLNRVQADLAEIGEEHFVRLTEAALRRLNNPAALARCQLIDRIPRTLAATRARDGEAGPNGATPLEQAQALREVLATAIERLRPADQDRPRDAPGALQHHILREEYLLGKPNNQIMVRHSISEGTFHRNRREAIVLLARELKHREELFFRTEART